MTTTLNRFLNFEVYLSAFAGAANVVIHAVNVGVQILKSDFLCFFCDGSVYWGCDLIWDA